MSARADIQAGRATVSLRVNQDQFTQGLQQARSRLSSFGSELMGIGAKATAMGSAVMGSLIAPIKLASDFEESFSKFSFIFGDATKATKAWGDSFAAEVGRSKLQVTNFLGDSQALFIPIGFEPGAATDMSKEITKLSVDLASFYNKQDADAFRDIQSALVGSSETMLKYGVIANEAAVKQELLNMAIDPANATNMQKVMARYNIIMRDTAAAQGDAIRTADGAANQWKALKATLTDMAVEIGQAVLPMVAKLTSEVVNLLRPIANLITQNRGIVVSFAAAGAAAVAAGVSIMGVGIAARGAALAAGVVSGAYAIAARAVSIGWTAVGLVITAFQIKSILAAKIFTAAWRVASTAIVAGFKIASTVITSLMTVTSWVATAALITAAWGGAAIAIAASYLGLGTVLSGVAAFASGAWTAAAGVAAGAWAAVGASFAASGIAAKVSAMLATTAWSIHSAVMTAIAAKQSVSAALLSLAWAGAAKIASLTWTGLGAILTATLVPANLLAAAGFAATASWGAFLAVVGSPITILAVTAALAASAVAAIGIAAGVAAVRSADLASAIEGIRGRLQSVMQSATAFGSVLSSAISAGDYATAWKVVMQGGKLAIAEAVIAMRKSFTWFFSEVWGMAKTFMSEFVRLSFKTVSIVAVALANPLAGGMMLKKWYDEMGGLKLNLSIGIDGEQMRTDAIGELVKLERELASRQMQRQMQHEANEIRDQDPKISADKARKKVNRLIAFGEMSPEEGKKELDRIDAQESQLLIAAQNGMTAAVNKTIEAYDRETDAIQNRITALREGEAVAEAARLKKDGLSGPQIAAIMKLRAEEEALDRQRQVSQARLNAIAEAGQIAFDSGKFSSQQVAEIEKKQIADAEAKGFIDQQSAKSAMADADLRVIERDLQKSLDDMRKKFQQPAAAKAGDNAEPATPTRSNPVASVATTNAYALVAAGRGGSADSPMVREFREQRREAKVQADKHLAKVDVQIELMRNMGLWHS